jgi:hypothetical protein
MGGADVVSDAQPAPGGGDTETRQKKTKRDAISNLLLKHLHTTLAHICLKTDETLEIYVRNTYKNN